MAGGQDKPAGSSKNTLSVTSRGSDNRTGKTYQVAISPDNSVDATAFGAMKAPFAEGERKENETPNGLRVFDPGFMNTAVLRSRVTYIDGEKGILRYRGYPIEQLAEKSSFLEVAYLLIYGDLPTRGQMSHFSSEVMHHSSVHNDIEKILSSFRYDAHPMAILTSSFAALGTLAPEGNPALAGQDLYTNAAKDNITSLQIMDKQIFRLIGKAPTLAAGAYRVRQGRPFNRPPPGLSYSETFLYLLDYFAETDYRPNPVFAKALDVLFLLHADHEMNASAATVLQAGSSLNDPYSAVAAGCASLYGPLHGGANEAVIRMLQDIGSPENVPAYIEKVKRKEKVLFGLGHRVYKSTDPRSKVIRKIADEVFAVTGKNKLLETAMRLHDTALKDDYFVKRKLYPNVDFWSGLIYQSMGVPVDMMVVLFAVPRVVGWLAHWRQFMLSGNVKIWRPRQLYIGQGERDYVGIRDREDAAKGDPKLQPTTVAHPTSIRAMFAIHRDKPRDSHL